MFYVKHPYFRNFTLNNEYLSCDIIEYGFDAQINSINLCCRISGDNCNQTYTLIPEYHGEKINWTSFFEKKQTIRNIHKDGNIFEPCKGCIYLREEPWDNQNIIKTVNINNWIKCNADCIYCNRSGFKNNKEYKILPVFKDMIDKNLLQNGGPITISGGEPTIIKEFDALLNIFLKNNLNNIKVLTNGIQYNKTIEKGLKTGCVNILISTDSGTRETFKRIKRTDKHKQVWNNLKKYSLAAKTSELVKTKFIIIPGINDNKDEILQFLIQNTKHNIKHCEIDIEISWFYSQRENQTNFDKIYDLYEYSRKKANELDLSLEAKDRMILLLDCLKK